MKANRLRLTTAALAAAAALCGSARAEDIDLFTTPAGGGTAPNILIVLDNSSNWNRNDQAWPLGKQGEGELRALYTILGDAAVNESVNMGLMMFSSSNSPEDSAYVRFHVRNMTPANKQAFRDLIGTAACPPANNSLTGKKNCILRDFSSSSGQAGNASNNSGEMINSASTRYSGAMLEIFKYFGGYTDPPRAFLDQPGSPVSSTKFGPAFFSTQDRKFDPGAYSGSNYVSPIDANNSCAKNFVIFIGNGYPSNEASTTYLSGINGDPTVPPPIGTAKVIAANWAKYLFTTDVSPQLGRQNVYTYTINVFNAKEEIPQTTLMKAMAKYGGGRYFAAKNENEIIQALREIIIEIQSVNSVFASASLPINATNRSQNENQVFIGMFRPDANAKPMWYGNLKEYKIALFGGDAKLADSEGKEAIAASTGFLQACAVSDHTTPTGIYWDWSSDSHGSCGSVANSTMSDYPDGGVVEKGGAAEVLRKGNDPSAAAPFTVNRTMYTCAGPTCGSMVPFTVANVTAARVGAADAIEHANIINFTRGQDVNNENTASSDLNAASILEPRPSIHGDIAHSRPLPVNFGGARGVEIFYGANDGTFKAVKGDGGTEIWSFVAPEHHGKLKRLYANTPPINYPPPSGVVGGQAKDYFFDGASGLLQNADNSKVWIFPTMRRGGRMLYAFDISNTTPALMWARGCPNMDNNTDCSPGYGDIGQTWSGANVAYIRGQGPDDNPTPLIIVGGGYDPCLDTDAAATTCTSAAKGRKVYVIDAASGAIVGTPFTTDAPVVADITLIDRDFNGMVDHAYVADALGSVYRIDFTDPVTYLPIAWTMSKVAETVVGNRKFLFGPAALAVGTKVYLALGTGDRERPLISNYPYTTPIVNRFYSFIDDFSGTTLNLNGASMENFTADTDCNSILGSGKKGWFMDLSAGTGEQTVTSAVIFGGTVFFSTNRPTPVAAGTCGTNLGEARGYAVNLLNASGVIGTGKLCGGSRSGVFTGGGIPPSPVVGIVPITQPDGTTKPTNVLIGGINLDTGSGSPIGAQEPKVPIRQLRTRLYWYPQGDR